MIVVLVPLMISGFCVVAMALALVLARALVLSMSRIHRLTAETQQAVAQASISGAMTLFAAGELAGAAELDQAADACDESARRLRDQADELQRIASPWLLLRGSKRI